MTSLIPMLGRQRQVDGCEFQNSQRYLVRPCLKQNKKPKKTNKPRPQRRAWLYQLSLTTQLFLSRLLLRENSWTLEENVHLEIREILPSRLCTQTERFRSFGQCLSGMLAVKNRNEQADLRAGNVWRDTGQCCRAALKSTQRTRLVKRQRQGATERESGCCQGCGRGPTQAASLNPVTASAGMPPRLALTVPPGPTQLCHTTQDQALELSKVALAALTKLHLMRAQNSNHCALPQRPAVLSTWLYPVFSGHRHRALWGPRLESVTLRPCVACRQIPPLPHSCLPFAYVSSGPGPRIPVTEASPSAL